MNTNTTRVHTTCCGVDPYDKVYGLGAHEQREYGGFSPYERIESLRTAYRFSAPTEDAMAFDLARLRAFTEVYKNNDGLTPIMKKALALKKYMEECKVTYIEGELLMTDDGAPVNYTPLYPEVATWWYDEIRYWPPRERDSRKVHYTDEEAAEIMSTEEFWKNRNVSASFTARVPDEARKACADAGGMLVYNPTVNNTMSVGHVTPDYQRLLKMGIGGLRAYIVEHKEKLGLPKSYEDVQTLELYDANLIVLDAWANYFRRYANLAKELIDTYSSQQTKDELKQLSEMMEYLADGGAPRNFWEAAQMMFAEINLVFMENNGASIGLSRMDVLLHPFYKADLENGTFTKDFMQEILECFYLKNETHPMFFPESGNAMYRFGFKGGAGAQIMMGGMDKDGNDVTNDLSFMLLDATAHTRLSQPFIAVRYHKGTPYEFKVKVAELARLGTGHPKIFNDESVIAALVNDGVPLEVARDYSTVGCVEHDTNGSGGGYLDGVYVNVPKILELALNNGYCMICAGEKCPNYNKYCRGVGKSLGLQTGYLKDFKTYEEVAAAWEAQLKYMLERSVLMANVLAASHAERDDSPVLSMMVRGCIESGKSWMQGGAEYNRIGFQAIGPATVADSLTTLKKVVYEDKKATPEEFYDALTKNWEGHERLYQLVNSDKIPHYGNDDDYADEQMTYVFNGYCNTLKAMPPVHGTHKICCGAFSQVVNLMYGSAVGPTPDGRKAGEGVSANIEPVRTAVTHRDKCGPTALSRSTSKVDHTLASTGTLVNVKFGTNTISGEEGRDRFIDYLDSYMEQGNQHVQFMVANTETLIDAQNHPENYKDLLVRVSGFSSYFNALSRNFQDELIMRTEHELG